MTALPPTPEVPLTPDTIQRAREGWEAACDPEVRRAIQEAFDRLQAFSSGGTDDRVSGAIRRWTLRVLVRSLFRVTVEYSERMPAEPAILAANHLNHIDPILLLAELPAVPYYYILGDARSLYNHGWKRFWLRLSQGVIPLSRIWKEERAVMAGANAGREDLVELAQKIDRDVPDGSSIEMLRQLDRIVAGILARGDGLMVFPEGKLGGAEGRLEPLKRGTVTYALRSNVPIVPVALIGTKHLYLRKQLIVRFGEPLHFPPCKRPKSSDVTAAIEALESALTALLPSDYREPDGLKLLSGFLNRMFW
ncbi:MAG TPA: 1-acyl-sn-glycerol-3-phosphate acyltransferase [Oscillatoriales cyanobacterium M59_W2019_021]|nr:MAG: 1-acyl-sn-glycerol-3-phosphate acyltransferase [Cyanobacteria bacterium J055]HIK30586.1 1-acyl-sn-glycerol-3-phosphate acyltransferase [Oscillatoriales cyanobacterium M4454_W2019_049]HIK53060.1 1-acyl-sn-glycerol-3-phosphate acyltransferase [Oscillatoriales cyanobacterium M59_W2019_021]